MNMSRDSNETELEPWHGILGFFDPGILAYYREQSDKYIVRVDDYDGHVLLADDYAMSLWESGSPADGIDIRFTFRRHRNGQDTLAAFLPDLFEKSTSHVDRWRGFFLRDPEWPDTEDERFAAWTRRYLEGDWDVDNGGLSRLEETVCAINALTTEVCGKPLFKFEMSQNLAFPSAENTHRYGDAHRELYGYVIDGLDKDCIKALGTELGITLGIGSDRTVVALRKLLPGLPAGSALWATLDRISSQRRDASHAVRGPAKQFPAKEAFGEDLEQCLRGMEELLRHLESLLGLPSNVAMKRQETKRYLPVITAQPSHTMGSTAWPRQWARQSIASSWGTGKIIPIAMGAKQSSFISQMVQSLASKPDQTHRIWPRTARILHQAIFTSASKLRSYRRRASNQLQEPELEAAESNSTT